MTKRSRWIGTTWALALLLAACTGSTAAPAPNDAPGAPGAFTPIGEFDLSPASGPWGTQVVASATGLSPATTYDLMWTTVEGSWQLSEDRSEYLGREYKPALKKLLSVTTDAAGAFSASFTIPEDFGYQHDVVVMRYGETINKSAFDVDMQAFISPTSGPVGTPVTVEIRGVGWRPYESSFQLNWDNAYTGWMSSVTTRGLARAVIPAAGRPGTHYIQIGHSMFGPPYMNPQQQPLVADRPFPRIPFVITDGPAVMPPPLERQAFAIVPARPVDRGIWTSPYAAPVGTPATLHGKALAANSDVEITWAAMVGNRTVTGFQAQTRVIATTRTDASGAFTWRFTVPDDLGGTHEMTAKIGGEVVASTDLYIQTTGVPLDVDRGPSGTVVKVQLKGVGWTETEQIYHLVYDNAYVGYACAFQSAGDITMFVVMSGDPGWHYIDVYPGIYQGKETRPATYKVPQLTALDDHPGEPMPIFRWAFFITEP